MLTAIAKLINPRKRRDATLPLRTKTSPQARCTPNDAERSLARSLGESIDESVDRRHRHRLTVLVEAAMRIAHRHPHLTERLARLRLADDDAQAALSLIEALTEQELPSSLRLLRCACLIQAGRRTEAHQELCRWCHDRSAPIDARLMSALLDWETGDVASADAALRQNIRQLESGDERTLMAALCLAVEHNNPERVAVLAQQLRQCTTGQTCSPDVDVLMGTLGVAVPPAATHLSDPQIDDFVTELIAAEATIPALVESLQISPDRAITTMLVDAIERALARTEQRADRHRSAGSTAPSAGSPC